jgi:plastocyanin
MVLVFRAGALGALLSAAMLVTGCGAQSRGDAPGGGPAHAAEAATGPTETPAAAQGQAEGAAAKEVRIDNFAFSPRELTVAPGTTVTWVNHDDVPHTATSTARPRVFDSRTLVTDASYSFVFKTPGTYEYFCAVHPRMTGKILVK